MIKALPTEWNWSLLEISRRNYYEDERFQTSPWRPQCWPYLHSRHSHVPSRCNHHLPRRAGWSAIRSSEVIGGFSITWVIVSFDNYACGLTGAHDPEMTFDSLGKDTATFTAL